MKKTIIANYGDPDLGKTTCIKLVCEKLSKVADEVQILYTSEQLNGDICVIITINGVKVGISSQGDPRSAQKPLLDELVGYGCPIIITACRYMGATERNVESFQPEYRIMWTCNGRLYENKNDKRIAPKGIQDRFNNLWAEEVANLVEDWCYA